MKLFAFKQQKHNPNKLSTVYGETLWIREIIDEADKTVKEQDNYIVLESDDFKGYLISLGLDPNKQFI